MKPEACPCCGGQPIIMRMAPWSAWWTAFCGNYACNILVDIKAKTEEGCIEAWNNFVQEYNTDGTG